MDEFLLKVLEILTLPVTVMENATASLNAIEFDQTLLSDYLGYMHYFMGDTLYMMFSSLALIFGGASLWSFIVKGLNWLLDLIPFN